MSQLNRAWILGSTVLTAAALAFGCSMKVNNDLNAKGDQPLSDCVEDSDCTGMHEGCLQQTDGTSVFDMCDCAPGYSRDAGGDCSVWDGLIQAPGFDDQAPWTRFGDVAILPNDPGQDDTGIVQFTQDGLCGLARVSQTIDNSSSLAAMGPMVIQVTARMGPGANQFPYVPPNQQVSMGVGINGHWTSFPAPSDWLKTRVCIGESDLGGPIALSVGTMAHLDTPTVLNCDGSTNDLWDVEITRVDILPADPDECPAVGEIRNPHFELSGGWDVVNQTGPGSATLTPGAGKDRSQGMALAVPMNPGTVAITTPYLWPADTTDAQALTFWMKGVSGDVLQVRSGAYILDDVTATGIEQEVTVCIPTYLNGTGQDITFGTPEAATWSAGTSIVVDDVSVHAEPDCGEDAYVTDGSFEYGSFVPPLDPRVSTFTSGTATATTVNSPTNARTGVMSFAISSSNTADGLFPALVAAPHFWAGSHLGDARGEPAVTYWYLAEDIPDFHLRTSLDGSNDWITSTTDWHRHVVCLPSRAEGRPVPFRFLYQPITMVNQAVATQTVYIDDIQVVNDPSCSP